METNTCNVNHLNADALLPPRKRLLAGLKRQSSDVHSLMPTTTSHSSESEYNARLNNLMRLHLSSDRNLSNEEIVEASRCAAIRAAEVAEAARANAEQKAAKAAKAMAAAKSALDLVASLSEEASGKEKHQKKNKMKKHVPVQAFYNRNKRNTNCKTDEELARKLHQAINSSPRILKSDSKNQKHKKLKTSMHNGVPLNQEGPSKSSNGVGGQVDMEGPIKDIDMIMVDLNTSKHDDRDRDRDGSPPKLENGVSIPPKDNKSSESPDSTGKKRGRTKQKKLPLSICSFRDQTSSPKGGEMKPRGEDCMDSHTATTTSGDSLMPSWKCQAFRAPQTCITQSKVMQS
ncbi:uncharacterized protein LOC127256461 isoform X2 [Andrographis paniculata]|nr:uncharacterized protein LOC127256461 isoform X2 [Andrographis paniculata]XP_051138440.1 uncharacterized protein LOC127256461 isoform X2 [Andrographis paniculata]